MAKSLGLIHTTKYNYEVASGAIGEGNAFLCDTSAKLSTQFNRNIRMMQSYKWVGTDLIVNVPENNPLLASDRMVVKGRLRYMQPTKGRCEALRDAYQQFRETARQQGVDVSKNKLFDFRVIPRARSNYAANIIGTPTNPILNLSTLNGTDELTMIGATETSAFPSYNEGVKPTEEVVTGADFASGLQTQVGTLVTQTDFVLEEGTIQTGNSDIADLNFEEIPFELAYDTTARRVTQLNWRPDPALYVSVLGGFIEIVLDEITAEGAGSFPEVNGVEIEVSHHFAGWTSIVKPPRMNFGKRSRSAKNMRAIGSKLSKKNIKDLLALAAMAKKMK